MSQICSNYSLNPIQTIESSMKVSLPSALSTTEKCDDLTIESLQKFPGFTGYTDAQANSVVTSIKAFAKIVIIATTHQTVASCDIVPNQNTQETKQAA